MAIFFVGLLLAGTGCLTSPPDADTSTAPTPTTNTPMETPSYDKPPSGLDTTLYELVQADNRTAFAATHQLSLHDQTVMVEIRLRENRSIPDSPALTVTDRYDRVIEARVNVDGLISLANDESIAQIRPIQTLQEHTTKTVIE